MSLNAIDRKKVILELLDINGKVTSKELVMKLEVSSETVRRYLDELENENKLRKVYGGAVKLEYDRVEPTLLKRNNTNIEEKKKIAKRAAEFVKDNDSVVIDEGTTALQMIKYIIDRKNLTIVTSSCAALAQLIDYQNKEMFDGEIIFIGGRINAKHQRSADAMSVDMMSNIFVNKAFISCEGISDSFGINSVDKEKALLSREYVKNSRKAILLSDNSKIGMNTTYKIAEIKDIDVIISDVNQPEEWTEKLDKSHTKWITC
ncbi:MAG: DeoR/GlpR family DNA-binding transcription regulator [Peptostreptococcaceae bacterium]